MCTNLTRARAWLSARAGHLQQTGGVRRGIRNRQEGGTGVRDHARAGKGYHRLGYVWFVVIRVRAYMYLAS